MEKSFRVLEVGYDFLSNPTPSSKNSFVKELTNHLATQGVRYSRETAIKELRIIQQQYKSLSQIDPDLLLDIS